MQKQIIGYPNYSVDEFGDVLNNKTGKHLKWSFSKAGYASVELFNKSGSKRFLVHRLVATAFIDNPNNYPQVNHKDENKSNNCVSNLEWCTAKYNMNYGEGAKSRHKKIDYSKPIYKDVARINGRKTAKAVVQFDKEGNYIKRFNSGKEASRETGLDHSHIMECCNGRRYKTVGGYVWRYERGSDLLVAQF